MTSLRAFPSLRRVALAALFAALPARAGATNCTLGYPATSSDPRTSVVFNESEVLRAFDPQDVATATPGLTIKLWYNDEHAMVLGVRRVIVKTAHGTTTTDYPVAALPQSPSAATHPAVGTTALDGDQAGTDTTTCAGAPDLCDRPMFPALFLTDITADPTSRAGDWQAGGTPIAPHAVFGSWKAAVRTVDTTHSPAVVTVTPDADPTKNDWHLAGGDAAPAGLKDEGYGAEVRWNVDELVAAGAMVMGHTYRLQFMVHDGDQNQTGGDVGENCVNVTFPECTTAADCDDRNACTTESCENGVCQNIAIEGCRPCSTAADCGDEDSCTTDSCDAGVCHNSIVDGCRSCNTVADCADDNPCTSESCDDGICHSFTIADCRPCNTNADCDDGSGCTTDVCNDGTCSNAYTPGCRPCATATDCADSNPCTDDTCSADGVCHYTDRPGCIPCHTAADCNDGNPCTTDACSADGSCAISAIPGCRRCTTAAQCDDGDPCSTDSCSGGVCVNGPSVCEPPIEVCDDGRDNDGDGLVDCNDPDCATSPACKPHEICGNCIDDDGNGLTDFEDPACCTQSSTFPMDLKTGRLRPRGSETKLRLGAILARSGLKVNPLTEDVIVQIRPEGGTDVFCARIPAAKFMKKHGAFMFWDHTNGVPSAQGLLDMRIKVRRNGTIRFKTHGKRAEMLCPNPGRLQVTVGFHSATAGDGANRCSTTSKSFRANHKGVLTAR